eukprot:12905852-Alexandrium_andersonii.AAC.1
MRAGCHGPGRATGAGGPRQVGPAGLRPGHMLRPARAGPGGSNGLVLWAPLPRACRAGPRGRSPG